MASLEEIRARLRKQEGSRNQTAGDNQIYAHWDIPEDSTAKLRFLPDQDPNNAFFWVERLMINLSFSGVKGQPESKPFTMKVPCMEMWGESCPVLTEVRPWYKQGDPELEKLASKYWKKRSYLFQGFVREDPANGEVPENPIRRFVITPTLFNIIKAALMDDEIEELPTDYENGLDFHITKLAGGQWPDYKTSKWARKESALTEAELAAIEEHGLYDLKEFLPKKPNETEVKVIEEMFKASVDNEMYDPELWAEYFRPYGMDNPNASSTDNPKESAPKAAPKPAATSEDDPPFEADKPAAKDDGGDDKVNDILAQIRARKSA